MKPFRITTEKKNRAIGRLSAYRLIFDRLLSINQLFAVNLNAFIGCLRGLKLFKMVDNGVIVRFFACF